MFGDKVFDCVFMLITATSCVNSVNNKWVAPDAWGLSEISRDKTGVVDCTGCPCPQNGVERNKIVASIFYGKFIKFIFNRNRMAFDDNSEIYTRPTIFKITSTQLDLLEQSTDPRDWDSVLADVLPKTEFPKEIQNDFIADIFELTKLYIFNAFISSETRFTLILLASILLIMYISRKHNYGLICTVLAFCFLFGLIYSYYECNRELEIRELADIMENDVDPCLDIKQQDEGFWNWFKVKSSKRHCAEFLINKHKIKLPYCKPEDVLMTYFHNILFEHIFLITKKSTEIFKKLYEKIPFPYNFLGVVIFGLTLRQFIELIFKYILSPSVWRTNGNNTTAEAKDQISGENLKILLESVKSRNENTSGIQIIQSVPSTTGLILEQHENSEEIVDATTIEAGNVPN